MAFLRKLDDKFVFYLDYSRENGSSSGQDAHLTPVYLATVHMRCSQVHACPCVGNEPFSTVLLYKNLHPLLCAGEGGR